MIDEPLALLAEAFGQDPERLIPSRPSSEAVDDAEIAIAKALVEQAESAAFAARTI